jgi:hypothetical protein
VSEAKSTRIGWAIFWGVSVVGSVVSGGELRWVSLPAELAMFGYCAVRAWRLP